MSQHVRNTYKKGQAQLYPVGEVEDFGIVIDTDSSEGEDV